MDQAEGQPGRPDFLTRRPVLFGGLLALAALLLGLAGVGALLANPIVTVQLQGAAIPEGNTGTSTATFTVNLSQVLGAGQQIVLAVTTDVGPSNQATAGTACGAGVDYLSNSTTLTFNPGDISRTFPVTICGDTVDELNESFVVRVTVESSTVGTIQPPVGQSTQVVAIITDDDNPTVQSISGPTVLEHAGPLNFVVTLSAAPIENVVIAYSTGAGGDTATPTTACPAIGDASQDYVGVTNGTLVIPAGQQTGTIPIQVCDDAIPEPPGTETLTLVLNPANSFSVNLPFQQTTAIGTIEDSNAPPTIPAGQTFNVNENSPIGTVVSPAPGRIAVTDPDGPGTTFTVTGGTGQGLFTVNATTGEIAANRVFDFETPPTSYTLTVQVCDGGTPNRCASGTVTINVNDVNDPPVVQNATFSIAENSPAGTAVGTVTATDPDAPAQTLTYSITGGNTGGAFAINAGSGQITVAGALDYETLTAYSLTVQVCDNGSPSLCATGTVTVNVTDANDPPVVENATFSIAENSPVGTNVGTPVVASDPDRPAQTLTYSITGGNTGGAFAINAGSGQITVAGALDYETLTAYSLTVQVCDNGSPSLCATGTVTVNVTDANDAPIVDLNGSASGVNYTAAYTEQAPPALIVDAAATVTDPDATAPNNQIATLVATITDPRNGAAERLSVTTIPGISATYNPTTGALTITGPASAADMTTVLRSLRYENSSDNPGAARRIEVVATDGGGLSGPVAVITLTITGVDDAPGLVNNGLTVGEGQSAPISAAALQANDPDTEPENLRFTLTALPTRGTLRLGGSVMTGGSFTQADINAGRLVYTHDGSETTSDSFRFILSDGSTTLPEATFNITITPENDNPVVTTSAGATPYLQGQPPVVIDPGITVTDADTPTFNGGSLSVTLTGGAPEDRLDVLNQGDDPGQISSSGGVVRYGGVAIGSLSIGSGGPLVVLFNANATPEAVQALARAITFANTAAVTASGPRTATFIVSDGAGGNSQPATKVIDLNLVPVAVDDTLQVWMNGPSRLRVLANDTDPDGDLLTITAVGAPGNGSVQIIENGRALRYTPETGYRGPDTFTYTISDGRGGTATATVTLTVDRARVFLPVLKDVPVGPDLVVNFTLIPERPRAFMPARVQVTVTNRGRAPASNFWVDFYINPREAPTVNQPWNELCRDRNCRGIAWFYEGTLRPGESVTFTSTPQSAGNPNGYQPRYTLWDGFFENGSYSLYAYVDSWNRDSSGAARDPLGAIAEEKEDNNLAERQVTVEVDP